MRFAGRNPKHTQLAPVTAESPVQLRSRATRPWRTPIERFRIRALNTVFVPASRYRHQDILRLETANVFAYPVKARQFATFQQTIVRCRWHGLLHSPRSAQSTNSMKKAIIVCTVHRCNLAIGARLGHVVITRRVQQGTLVLGHAIYTASHERCLSTCFGAETKVYRVTWMEHVCRVARQSPSTSNRYRLVERTDLLGRARNKCNRDHAQVYKLDVVVWRK